MFFSMLRNRLFRGEVKIVGTLSDVVTEQDGKRATAIKIGLEVGLLEKCPIHGCVFDALNDFALEDAFRCGDALMSENSPLVAAFEGNRRRLRHAIENVRSGMPNGCPDCYYARFGG